MILRARIKRIRIRNTDFDTATDHFDVDSYHFGAFPDPYSEYGSVPKTPLKTDPEGLFWRRLLRGFSVQSNDSDN